jgi:hypothetical protein
MFGIQTALIGSAVSVAVIIGAYFYGHSVGDGAGYDRAKAEWMGKYDALVAANAKAREAERARQAVANQVARLEADRLVTELEAAREQSEDLTEGLRRERAKDASASAVCGSLDAVMRFNRAIGHPGPASSN